MTGRHFSGNKVKKSSKKPAMIITIAIAAVIIIAVAAVLFIPSCGNLSDNLQFATHPSITEHPQTTAPTDLQEQTTEAAEQTIASEQSTQQENTNSAVSKTQKATEEGITIQSSDSESVVVPGNLENATYFSATFSPYKAVDSETGEECSLKEVFGSSYSGGSIVFSDDGRFTDSLTTSSSNSGAYAVQDSNLAVTYSNDKNMDVAVNAWEGNTPTDIVVNYGGYNVYLN